MTSLFYVEDDEMLAHLTIKALTRRGFHVTHCETLIDARASLNNANYSHALLDLKLEDGNAISLISALLEVHPTIKIVLLTGYASIATAVQAIKLGAHNYLSKPATIDEILMAFGELPDVEDVAADGISLKRLEWEKIQQALVEHEGNISATARHLKMHRRTLQRKLDKRPVSD